MKKEQTDEEFFKTRLAGNIKNIHVLFRQLFGYTGDDADTVSTNNSHNNFLHQVSSFPSLLATAAHVALPLL